MARSAWSVGTSVLVKASEDPESNKWKGMYALVIMIMLIKTSESRRTFRWHTRVETYRKHDSIDGRDVFDFTRRV